MSSTSNNLLNILITQANKSAEDKLKTGLTWNGDINYGSLGSDLESKILELDQIMLVPPECNKEKTIDLDTLEKLNSAFQNVIDLVKTLSDEERAKAYGLLFRYLFYVRSIRIPGKKSRLLFHYLFGKMYALFPQTCLELIPLIPEYGYFGDLDILLKTDNPEIIKKIYDTYYKYLNTDCQLVWGKELSSITKYDAIQMNNCLRIMTTNEIREFVNNKNLSLASKWFKREGKSNSTHRQEFIDFVYFPKGINFNLGNPNDLRSRRLIRKRQNYSKMVFRNIISSLTQCLLVGEQMMCEKDQDNRTWGDIPLNNMPAKFITKYRKALSNETLNGTLSEKETETGNRHPENEDRVRCRKNLLKVLIEGKLKGASQDIERLSKIIFSHIIFGKISDKLTYTERLIIASQWTDLVNKLKHEINTTIDEIKEQTVENGEVWLDPRNVIPVIDTSGSMSSCDVLDKAIGLGILGSHLSSMSGCLISFSEKPQVFYLDRNKDVFDHFLTILNGPKGLNTNIDATYRLLLDLMITSETKETDFALLFLTDGQFDSQVILPSDNTKNNRPRTGNKETFLNRIEKAFNTKGYNLPRTIFWNLNCKSPGFPATSFSKGVQLVSGYSQTLMLQVFTGNYKYEVQEDGTNKININPWDNFLNALLHQGYDQVTQVVISVGEDCLKYLHNSN